MSRFPSAGGAREGGSPRKLSLPPLPLPLFPLILHDLPLDHEPADDAHLEPRELVVEVGATPQLLDKRHQPLFLASQLRLELLHLLRLLLRQQRLRQMRTSAGTPPHGQAGTTNLPCGLAKWVQRCWTRLGRGGFGPCGASCSSCTSPSLPSCLVITSSTIQRRGLQRRLAACVATTSSRQMAGTGCAAVSSACSHRNEATRLGFHKNDLLTTQGNTCLCKTPGDGGADGILDARVCPCTPVDASNSGMPNASGRVPGVCTTRPPP